MLSGYVRSLRPGSGRVRQTCTPLQGRRSHIGQQTDLITTSQNTHSASTSQSNG